MGTKRDETTEAYHVRGPASAWEQPTSRAGRSDRQRTRNKRFQLTPCLLARFVFAGMTPADFRNLTCHRVHTGWGITVSRGSLRLPRVPHPPELSPGEVNRKTARVPCQRVSCLRRLDRRARLAEERDKC